MANEFDHAGFEKAHKAATQHNITSQPSKAEEEPKNDFEKAQRLATQHDAANTWKSEAAKPQQVAKDPTVQKPEDKKADLGPHDQAQWQKTIEDKKQDKPKEPVITAAAPVVLDPNRMAISGDTNQNKPKAPDTRELQIALDKAGFETGPIDGIQGRLTNASIMAFAERTGIDPQTTSVKEMIEHVEKFTRLQTAYNQEFGNDKTQLAQAPTSSEGNKKPESSSWVEERAQGFYDPVKTNALKGVLPDIFETAATKPASQQPTHALLQDMSIVNMFKPA
jgi:peptidoglycan hydrolase-like protein with peptidoglycan-binding domain